MSEFQYWEGQIISRDNRGTLVEWHDGKRERLINGVDEPINYLPNGEFVGMRVRVGADNKVAEIQKELTLLVRLR